VEERGQGEQSEMRDEGLVTMGKEGKAVLAVKYETRLTAKAIERTCLSLVESERSREVDQRRGEISKD